MQTCFLWQCGTSHHIQRVPQIPKTLDCACVRSEVSAHKPSTKFFWRSTPRAYYGLTNLGKAYETMPLKTPLIVLIVPTLLVGFITIVQAQQYKVLNCQDLWSRRVSLLQKAGVCVQIPGGFTIFGSLKCKYTTEREASISREDRTYLFEIREAEIFMRCSSASNNG